MKLVKNTEMLKDRYHLSYAKILPMLPLSSSSYRRWRLRIVNGLDPVLKPGPKPLKPLDMQKLSSEMEGLRHGKKRSRGAGRVHTVMKDFISRRELCGLIARMRRDSVRDALASQSKLHWLFPGAAWSMDIFEIRMPKSGKIVALCVQDLASGYKLPPLTTIKEPQGDNVAAHLKKLFQQHGPPLFLKRDNGGNLNHHAVEELLSCHHVLPLNSPCYCAPYNGAIEHGQGEIKWKLKQEHGDAATFGECTRGVELAVHDLNHLPRRKFGGDTSCRRFFGGPHINYSKRKRKEVFLWISEHALDIVEEAGEKMTSATAWRIACRIWLVKNGLLLVSKCGEVLPTFSGKTAHN